MARRARLSFGRRTFHCHMPARSRIPPSVAPTWTKRWYRKRPLQLPERLSAAARPQEKRGRRNRDANRRPALCAHAGFVYRLRGAGPVAQWLEPTAHNGLVAGSSPAGPTTHSRRTAIFRYRYGKRAWRAVFMLGRVSALVSAVVGWLDRRPVSGAGKRFPGRVSAAATETRFGCAETGSNLPDDTGGGLSITKRWP
jgi:hypothetical protein